VAQEGHAGFEMAGEFSTLEIGGFWDGHTPKTPPFVVPIRDRSYVQEFCVQHSLNLKMSGAEKWMYKYQPSSWPRLNSVNLQLEELSEAITELQMLNQSATMQA